MNKPKVLITVTNDVAYDRRMHRIAATLDDAGYEVHRVGRLLTGPPDPKPGITLLKCPFRQGPLFYWWFNVQLYFFSRRFNHDIHVSVDTDTLLAGLMVCFGRKKKLVYDSHEWFERTPELLHAPFKRWLWFLLGRNGARRAVLRMTVSFTLADALEKSYGYPFEVIRNLPRYVSSVTGGQLVSRTIVYLGVLNAGRGLEIAIDALRELQGYRLKLVGEGDLSSKLRQQVRKLGLEDRVQFCGQVEPEQIEAELAGASFGFLMLDPASDSYQFSLANKFFDYVQAGLPVLCSSLPEYRALMESHSVGMLINEYSSESLITTLKKIDQNPSGYVDMLDACRAAAKDWCWETEAPKLLKLFDRLR